MAEEIKKILEDYKDETKRHFDLKMNDITNKIHSCLLKIALTRVNALEKRVSMLEAKLNK